MAGVVDSQVEGFGACAFELGVVDDGCLYVLDGLRGGERHAGGVHPVVLPAYGSTVDGLYVHRDVGGEFSCEFEFEHHVGEVLSLDGLRAFVLSALGAGLGRNAEWGRRIVVLNAEFECIPGGVNGGLCGVHRDAEYGRFLGLVHVVVDGLYWYLQCGHVGADGVGGCHRIVET